MVLSPALIDVGFEGSNCTSWCLLVVCIRDERGGIGGGSGVCGVSLTDEDWDDEEKHSDGDIVGDGVLLVLLILLPFNKRRRMGGLRRVIWSGTDGRRDEDGIVDGGDGFVVDDESTKNRMFLY